MAAVDGNEAVEGEDQAETRKILALIPKVDHVPEKYDDLVVDFCPAIFSSLEKHLPSHVINLNKKDKAEYMSRILHKHYPHEERRRVKRLEEYREKIRSSYQPLEKKLYTYDPTSFLLPSFLNAIKENTERSIQSIIFKQSRGVYVVNMFQPEFCEMMLSEVENFRKWAEEKNFQIIRPNTFNKHGAVLEDFGLDRMLNELIEHCILPIAKVVFSDVGGTLVSHHGFVVEYGEDRDSDLGFHVDDSDVTLNVCLGKKFVGGELYFQGARCEDHLNVNVNSEEKLEYSHVPGQAVLHRGCYRHGAKATTSGHRVNMILWCRSSEFREMRNYHKDFSKWCDECKRLKWAMRRQRVTARGRDVVRQR